MATTETTEAPLVEAEVLYQGARISSGGDRYIVVSPTDQPHLTSSFTVKDAKNWKKWSYLSPGAIVKAKVRLGTDDEIATIQMAPSYLGMHEDETQRLRWATEHRLALAELERKRLAKSEADELHRQLEPVRHVYQSAVGWKRTALLAEIVRFLTS